MSTHIFEFEEKLNIIQEPNELLEIESKIKTCEEYLKKIKISITDGSYESLEDEIIFFKITKPQITSKLYFFIEYRNILLRKLPMDNKSLLKFYKKELKKSITYLKENQGFYQYLHSGDTSLDHKLFTRNQPDINTWFDTSYYSCDPNFSTPADNLVAKIYAQELLIETLKKQISKHNNQKSTNPKKYQWTENKIDLVELIYAIHAKASINKGDIEISEIASIFSEVFNEDLGNIYRIYAEIKIRKNPTRYIDQLKDKLLQKIDIELGN
ncbi:MAG: RteC domain-containing protein [Spirosomataceae bacterium]